MHTLSLSLSHTNTRCFLETLGERERKKYSYKVTDEYDLGTSGEKGEEKTRCTVHLARNNKNK